MNSNINERLIIFFDSLKKPYRQTERTLGLSNGTIGKLKKGISISSDKLEKISSIYSQLNPSWVLNGVGDMLFPEPSSTKKVNIPTPDLCLKQQKEIEELKKDKAMLTEQITLKDQQIHRLWNEIDELKK